MRDRYLLPTSRRSRLDLDRLLFRPDISQVGADRASVMRCRRSLLVAVGRCCCCHRCCHPRDASAPGTFPPGCGPWCAAPLPHRTDCCRSIRRREGVKGGFACTLTRHFLLCSLPCGTVALDAVPEAYHNPAAVRWGPLHLPPACRWLPVPGHDGKMSQDEEIADAGAMNRVWRVGDTIRRSRGPWSDTPTVPPWPSSLRPELSPVR